MLPDLIEVRQPDTRGNALPDRFINLPEEKVAIELLGVRLDRVIGELRVELVLPHVVELAFRLLQFTGQQVHLDIVQHTLKIRHAVPRQCKVNADQQHTQAKQQHGHLPSLRPRHLRRTNLQRIGVYRKVLCREVLTGHGQLPSLQTEDSEPLRSLFAEGSRMALISSTV